MKVFCLFSDKEGNFQKIEKGYHLAHTEQALTSAIDNLGLYALTIAKNYVIRLWNLYSNLSNPSETAIDSYAIGLDRPLHCAIHTVKDINERVKTVTVFADENNVAICDRHLKVYETLQGVDCVELYMIGSMKNVVLATLSSAGKLTIWNITSIVEKMPEYTI